MYITEVNGIRTGRADQPDAQHRLHIYIGVSGTSKRERDLKHAYVCGIGPSQAVRVGAKALCAAFRVEEQPTEALGGWGVGLKKLLREALARAIATLPPPAIVVAPVFNAHITALATAASPTTTLAPANSPASIAPAAPPASLAPAASTLAPDASTLAPAASPASTAPAAPPTSTLATVAIAPTNSANVAAPIIAAPILEPSTTTTAPAAYLVTPVGAGQPAADRTDAIGDDMSDGGWASEDPDQEMFDHMAGEGEPAAAAAPAAIDSEPAATDSAPAATDTDPAAGITAATAAPTEGTVPPGEVAQWAAPQPQQRRASRRLAVKASRGGRAHAGPSTWDLLQCCDDVLLCVLSNLDVIGVSLVAATCHRLLAVVAGVARNKPFWACVLFKRCALAEPVADPRLLCQALQLGMETATPPLDERDAVGMDAVRAWWRCKVLRVQGPHVLILYDGYELPEWRCASDVRVAPVRVPVTEMAVLCRGVLEVSYSTKPQCRSPWWEAVVESVHGVRSMSVSWLGDPMFEGEVAHFPLLRKSRPFSPLLRVALPSVEGGREAVAQGAWTQYIAAACDSP